MLRKEKSEKRESMRNVCSESVQIGCVTGDTAEKLQWLRMWGVLTSSDFTTFENILVKESKKLLKDFKEAI